MAIVENPTLWAECFKKTYQEGTAEIHALQEKLHRIPGPIARARECQTLLALDLLNEAMQLVEHENHPLCQAMRLMALLIHATPEAYLQITERPESVGADPFTPIGQESQMRWDFVRAQAFHRMGQKSEALELFTVARRTAKELGVDTIFRACESQIVALSPDPIESKIANLLFQLEQVRQAGDQRAFDFMTYSLCFQYARIEHYAAYLEWAQQVSESSLKDHMVYGAKLLLGLPVGDSRPPDLEGLEDHGFATLVHAWANFRRFKRHLDFFKDRRTLHSVAEEVWALRVPRDVNYPLAGVMALCLQAVVCSWFGRSTKALLEELSDRLQISDMPKAAQGYEALARASVVHRRQGSLELDSILELRAHLERSATLQNFMTEICPELLHLIHNQAPSVLTERLLDQVLAVTEEGFFLGRNEMGGFPRLDGLKPAMDYWFEGDPMDNNHYKLVGRYGERLRELQWKGVFVSWRMAFHFAWDSGGLR